MAVENLNEKFTELLDKFDQLNVNNQHIVERLNRLEADAVPASNTGGVKADFLSQLKSLADNFFNRNLAPKPWLRLSLD